MDMLENKSMANYDEYRAVDLLYQSSLQVLARHGASTEWFVSMPKAASTFSNGWILRWYQIFNRFSPLFCSDSVEAFTSSYWFTCVVTRDLSGNFAVEFRSSIHALE